MGDDSNKGNRATTLSVKCRQCLPWIIRISKVIFLFITVFLLPILFNEVVQPLGSPRISTLSTEALHIQSQVNEDEKGDLTGDYYQISMVTYEVQPPRFSKNSWICKYPIKLLSVVDIGCNDSLRIDFPKDVEIFTPGSGFWEENPYITVPEEEPPFNQIFINSRDCDHIFVKVGTTATIVKTVPFKLYRREKISMSCSDPGYSGGFRWSIYRSSLEEVPRVYCSARPFARGWLEIAPNRKIMYDFYELVLSNRGNLDIRGFMTNVPIYTKYTEVCEDNENVNLIGDGDKRRHIRIDLKGGETRRMVILNQFSEDKSEEEFSRVGRQKEFNFTLAGCNGNWDVANALQSNLNVR